MGNYHRIGILALAVISIVCSLFLQGTVFSNIAFIAFALANLYSIYIVKDSSNRVLQIGIIIVVSLFYIMN
ncbi:hypothetical protein ACTQ46_07350 [Gallicola sp. Sow4_E12]|uniref:hypothetical protein n=1 Tax=Gallicola sp. Sow4_E12 TaxID=3438785 RepID=UPI003F8DCB4E